MSLFNVKLFKKDATAAIYLHELRVGFDSEVVPVFTPDTLIDVGDYGSFEKGRFVVRGNVATRGVKVEPKEYPVSPWSWASTGKVSVGPSVKVPSPTGTDLVKMTLTFSQAEAVAVSFESGFDRSVSDADLFGKDLMAMWLRGDLSPDRVVVWNVRQAAKGTIVVSGDKDSTVDLMADAGLLAGAGLSLANMSVGVEFGTQRKSTYKVSSGPLTMWMRLLRLLPGDAPSIGDAYRFEGGPAASDAAVGTRRPVPLTVDDILDMD
jgi:hypothetical protein